MTQVNMLKDKTDLSKLVQMTLLPGKPVHKRIGIAEGKFKVPNEF